MEITDCTPFSTPTTPAGAPYNRVVATIDLSTADLQYNNRGFKSANIPLNGQGPIKAQLTHYQISRLRHRRGPHDFSYVKSKWYIL